LETQLANKPHLEFTENSVIKFGPPAAIAVEAAKLRSAHELGRSSGLFRAPRLLSHDANTGRLEQERVFGFKNLQTLAAYGPANHSLWQRIGAILGLLHNEFVPQNCPPAAMPSDWQLKEDRQVWLHGDFNLDNVCYIESNDTILVTDWSLTPLLEGICTQGPASFDVAWLVKSLFFLPCRMGFPRNIAEKSDRFLAGYTCKSQVSLSYDYWSQLVLAAAELLKRKHASGLMTRALHALFSRRLERYLANGPQYRRYL